MAKAVQFKVEGLEQLKRAMRDLPDRIRGKVALELLRKAAMPMRDAARNRAPVNTGRLRKNIYVARARDSTRDNPLVVVRVKRRGKKDNPQNAFYWLFKEFGTRFLPAKPFMRPAFESTKLQSLELLRRSSAEQIAAAARKVAAYTARFRSKR